MDYRIVVDAGHGGVDSGAVSGNLQEKDFNLAASNYMYNRFKELGVPVVITRDTDKTLTRQERLNIMRSQGTDPKALILSNHINAGGGEGAEVVYPLRSDGRLARMILEEIGKEGQIMRKVYQRRLDENPSKDYYYIMRETPNTTSLLIEYGFIDNKNDQVKLKNYLLNYAEAVVRAVANYIGVPYKIPGQQLDNTYTVKAGDTLYSIARRFNTSVDELIALNNLTSTNLSVGQTLILSAEQEIEPDPGNGEVYTVKAGDTLFKIANTYNTTVQDILTLNNLNSTILSIGQQLLIPNKSLDEVTSYIVASGDTLYSIAKKYGIKVDDIISANNLTSTNLSIGQVLTIPVGIPNDNSNNNTPSTQTYTVQKGDSLWSIARKLNTTVDDLKEINNLVTNILQIGQILLIP